MHTALQEGGTAAAAGGSGSGSSDASEKASRPYPRQKKSLLDPHHLDLAAFLQVLVDVMVSCSLPSLRARGHVATLAFLGAASEAGRFRVLKRLIERCPWPNATGLLLDAFRREIDRALRHRRPCPPPGEEKQQQQQHRQQEGEGEEEEDQDQQQRQQQQHQQSSSSSSSTAPWPSPPSSSSSSFASPLAGDFVSEQLRRACRRGPPASLMVDMDSRTGGLTLARYAHALDFDAAAAGGDGAGGVGGRLKLREPEKLRENQLLVQVGRWGVGEWVGVDRCVKSRKQLLHQIYVRVFWLSIVLLASTKKEELSRAILQ